MELKIIKIQKSTKKNIYEIFFENNSKIELFNEILLKFRLRSGDIIEEKELNEILIQNQIYEAKNISMRLLAKRMRTEKEIIDRLKQKKFDEKIISTTVQEFKKINLINDDEFAERFINDSLLLQKNYIKNVLINKDIFFL